jgi:predicted dehydrogenase
MSATRELKAAIVGYGGMAKNHAKLMQRHGIHFAAVCDLNPDRLIEAAADYPGLRAFPSLDGLLAQHDIDLVIVATPHNAHGPLAMKIIEAGKHCIVEKPMCIRAEEAQALVRLARERNVMLSSYHNRRWDGWYIKLQELIAQGVLGDIFYVNMVRSGYHEPSDNPRMVWRSDKHSSGGMLYDWGAHYIDWLLGIVPDKVRTVRGYAQKRLFPHISNEDQVDGNIEFSNGAVAQLQISNISHVNRNHFQILGTKAAVADEGDGALILTTRESGNAVESRIPYVKGIGSHHLFYANIADHLLRDAELIVKPEQAMRTVAVLEAITRSAATGQESAVTDEFQSI